MAPFLARIDLYPVKSLDGVRVDQAEVLSSGGLKCDRTYALFDRTDRFINGKRNAQVHHLRTTFAADLHTLTLQAPAPHRSITAHLDRDRPQLESWLGDFFQQPVRIGDNRAMGFPDDTASPGPTIISTATLETVTAWYPGLSLDEVRARFRTNLEIGGVPSFWEDHLFGPQPVKFHIGSIAYLGINPCQRCIVPVRDTTTGIPTSQFQKTFSSQRAATLPPWSDPSHFNHFYRLAVNTRPAVTVTGRQLQVGDAIKIA